MPTAARPEARKRRNQTPRITELGRFKPRRDFEAVTNAKHSHSLEAESRIIDNGDKLLKKQLKNTEKRLAEKDQ
jgi:hypothetical protein